MKKLSFTVAAALCAASIALSCASCAKADRAAPSLAESLAAAPRAKADGRSALPEAPAGFALADAAPVSAPAPAEPAAPLPAAGRKLVYTADMQLEADDPAAVELLVRAAVASAGGYVASSNSNEYQTWLVVRVPVASLEPLMASLAGSGKTLSRSVSAEDVTDAYFDIEGRLRNLRILEDRYRDYLGRATKVQDMLDVEARLSETTMSIERLEGSFRGLKESIDLATLSLTIQPVRPVVDPSKPTMGESMRRLFAGLADAFRVAVVILVGLVVYGVPAVLAVAGLWWLCFGRLGLVRRLFSLVRTRGRSKAGFSGDDKGDA